MQAPLQKAPSENRKLYRTLFERMLEGVAYCRMLFDDAGQPTDWIYLDVNAAYETQTGLSGVIGKRVSEVIPGLRDTNPELFEAYGRVTASGISEKLETYVPAIGRWLAISIFRPGPEHFATIFENITEHMRVDEALRESEQRYRTVVDHLAEGVVVQDAAGLITSSNPAARSILGLDVDEITNPTSFDAAWHRLWPDGAQSSGEERLATIARTTGSPATDVVMAVQHSSGGTRWMHLNAQPLHDASGDAVTGAVISFRDVTERERLARERERLAAIVEQSANSIVIADALGRITYANPAFVSENGRTAQELAGRLMSEIMLEVLDPATIADIDRAITTGGRWLGNVDQHRADATSRHVEVSVTPGRDPDSAVWSYVSVFHDVTELREAEAALVLEARMRAVLAECLHSIPQEATLAEAADTVCAELVKLPFVDMAAIQAFVGTQDVQIIAHSAPPGYPVMAGTHLPPARAATVRERAAVGPWAGYAEADPADGGLRSAAIAVGLKALAYGPIVYGDHVAGCLVIGTFDVRFAQVLVEKMPGIVGLSAMSSALLADRLHALGQEATRRESYSAILDARAYRPVFQPIVDLETGEAVGFEALTRFDSGRQPDLCFADAWSVGLGEDLEIATLEASVEAARMLPAGRWLGLNASPRLFDNPDRLARVLQDADRPVVLEITEHAPVADYARLRDAVRELGGGIRLAVDDAGAGVANFSHIVELRPDFVKLDISFTRRVNVDLGRQALVVAMCLFTKTTGCRLIAEGIETAAEARTLAGFGVEFGQGYWFGQPEPVGHWTAATRRKPASRRRAIAG